MKNYIKFILFLQFVVVFVSLILNIFIPMNIETVLVSSAIVLSVSAIAPVFTAVFEWWMK